LAAISGMLYRAWREARASADKAKTELASTIRDREQLSGELAIATERMNAAVVADVARASLALERDHALAQLRELQQTLRSDDMSRMAAGDRAALDQEIRQKREALDTLQREIGALDTVSELQSFGLYRPHYAFDTPDEYKLALERIVAQQAAMLKDNTATVFSRQWMVDGSMAKGQQLIGRQVKLMLRAFNGECDAVVAKVRFNNVSASEERMRKAFNAINKLAETYECAIAETYLGLKLDELHLTHELAQKNYELREEQRELRELAREEQRVREEVEKTKFEEERAELALARARAELEAATLLERTALTGRVAELEARLAEAHAKAERAISLAQLTRAGHVYVISNEGSFGSNVFKIGMTRRADPEDRVRELGDASVPFSFDVHAMIYSEDAPELERKLHRALAATRVNLVNERKEFFAVTLAEIERAVRENWGKPVEFVRLAAAEEWRRTRVARAAGLGAANAQHNNTSVSASAG
jgi:hypothetical protein